MKDSVLIHQVMLYRRTDSTYDLGESSTRWRNVYADRVSSIFYENSTTVSADYTVTNGSNAMAAGPITIASGVTVTVGSDETLTIV